MVVFNKSIYIGNIRVLSPMGGLKIYVKIEQFRERT